MKKKIVSCILLVTLVMSCILPMTAYAKVGDVIGTAVHTDIVAYINYYAIPSYAANGKSCIVAEDLRNFGFDVIWDGNSRILSIYRNSTFYPNEMKVDKSVKSGTFFSNILETDIVVYANGQRITSYALNGYTMIPIEELTMFGGVNWVPEERAIKLWIDGFNQRSIKQSPVTTTYTTPAYSSVSYYPGTTVPTYTSIVGEPLIDTYAGDGSGKGIMYIYNYRDDDMLDYIKKLTSTYGWSIYKNVKGDDGTSVTCYLVKDSKLIGVTYTITYDQVWVIVG